VLIQGWKPCAIFFRALRKVGQALQHFLLLTLESLSFFGQAMCNRADEGSSPSPDFSRDAGPTE